MHDAIRSKVTSGGRVVIPAAFRHALGLADGDEVFFRRDEHGVHIHTGREALRHARQLLNAHIPADADLLADLRELRRQEHDAEGL